MPDICDMDNAQSEFCSGVGADRSVQGEPEWFVEDGCYIYTDGDVICPPPPIVGEAVATEMPTITATAETPTPIDFEIAATGTDAFGLIVLLVSAVFLMWVGWTMREGR